ncbi:response regulator [Legionella sp. km772]|uniref:response regulator n=1 Tax=Legionella sp. km772 TaxID=2498111 RepID=UPI000F8DFAA5|nr:response regulator [Legionella sp. km772]RUR09377.1 response regulator [Legionella sp. km772]
MNELNKIAYVEDDADLRFLVQLTLEEKGGFTLKTFANGQDFLAEVDAFQPQLILLDVSMPKVDGVSLFLELKKNSLLEGVPVIFFTAQLSQSDLTFYNALGVNKVIAKPYNPINLIQLLSAFWKKYQANLPN